ncbi:OpgC domain-containing protein [Enterovibrio sp. ZSDZ35]|uniref:OpgC domain-containing protein n=1 Tax=Enterovibrio qingdaonensis TaxID=2899818 RepID=A0ABT5QHU0_9GAMM|nr:OpgC domain-containing protein [Enterovibrio sp. ZSDZ35]MDD1780537.1 OpgC domain-containing protein [Enterovibrio sp. ZSDZ35]
MKRIPALDSLRGLLLVIMTFNHLIWVSGGVTSLQLFTLQPLGQFGAAEAFVFLSALLAGAIYSRPALSNTEVRKKAFKRAITIYRYHLICILAISGWYFFVKFAIPSGIPLYQFSFPGIISDPIGALILSITLLSKPNYLDILPLYIFFMVGLPFLIAAFRKGYLLWVMALSIAVWLCSGFTETSQLTAVVSFVFPNANVQPGYFDPFAWQILFTSGAALGYLAQNGSVNWITPARTIIAALIALTLFVLHRGSFLGFGFTPDALYQMADKPEIGWLRLLNILVWVYLVAAIIRHRPTLLEFKALSYIGRHSLHVFSWHVVLSYIVGLALFDIRFENYYLIVVFALVATLWIPAWIKEKQSPTLETKWWATVTMLPTLLVAVLSVNLLNPALETEQSDVASLKALAPNSIQVQVSNIGNENAPIQILLFKDTDDLMGSPSAGALTVSPEQAESGVVFENVAQGKYVILAFQDIDGNHYLTVENSVPQEGFGFSNLPIVNGPPAMSDVAFEHIESQTQKIVFNHLY